MISQEINVFLSGKRQFLHCEASCRKSIIFLKGIDDFLTVKLSVRKLIAFLNDMDDLFTVEPPPGNQ